MRYAIALLCGLSLTLTFAPFGQWYLMPVAVAVMLLQLSPERPHEAKWIGFLFGLGWFGAGISWVHVSIADFGGLPLAGSLGLMALLCAYLALFPMLLFHTLVKRVAVHLWPSALPVLWLLMEWLRSWLLTGFPWLSLGYSQINSPLAGWAPLLGETGLSALIVAMAMAMAHAVRNRQIVRAVLFALIPFVIGMGLQSLQWVKPDANTVRVAMVQGNIAQSLRWVPEQDRPTMEKYLSMTQSHWDSDLIIWPEAAIPKLEPVALDFLQQLDEQAIAHQTGLITGIVNYNFETYQAYNNLLALGVDQQNSEQSGYYYQHPNRYAKHHLLPIGEFIPLEDWLRGLAPIFDLPMSSFSRGDYVQPNLHTNGLKLAPAICFEIAFPRQIRANLNDDTDVIITVSNDAWFGRSHGPAQHLEIAQMRALELGMPVLRATNNGITAVINHQGRIQSRLDQFVAAVLEDDVQLTTGTTPYRRWGDTLPWAVFCVLLFIAWSRQHNR
ncbi:apolipoprotein N-acyltransferase [Aestuariibacter halophilus]|uniref:Apolipoprotein N-acyltransferase n=1 Tax=Fluctibacter halophilus TaxID=226011 RepID=A0ABS8G439_9ALTE|nr:apolipoprotein N-acyltransferase [Aestuariibacter halophilus]MCC2615298.1 apolipoprotein N-acyltransferase [Aestuariibacter halophilus]